MNAFIPYDGLCRTPEENLLYSAEFRNLMEKRRSIRTFSEHPVPKELIENLLMTASSAPSGAHKQPWSFCAIENADLKSQIRLAAEREEYQNYHGRMNEEWLADLAPFDTNWKKPFIERAPWIIVVFKKPYDLDAEGKKHQNYYVNESVGIATGFLLTAIHQAGLVALTHTPSPMNFLREILERPENERPFMLIPVGYPENGTQVPNLTRKPSEAVVFYY